METIKGTVDRVLFSSEETGYKVLRIRTLSGSPSVITGEFGPEIVQDTAANFHGFFKKHPKYGTQFKTTSYEITYDAQKLASIRLFIDNIAPNVGPERAQLIIDHFGGNTIKVLDNEPERLIEVHGIGKVTADSLAKAWKDNRAVWDESQQIYSLRAFLMSLGLGERRIKRVIAHFGGKGMEAEEAVRENPYGLVEVEGFGFSTVDFISKKLGIEENSPLRFRAFILYLLKIVCPSMGHLYLEKGNIAHLVSQYCMENSTSFLGKPTIDAEDIDVAVRDLPKITEDNGRLYSADNFHFESRSAEILASIACEKSDLIFLNNGRVEEHIQTFERDTKMVLSEEQKLALHYFANEKVFVITGAPGTGKTTLLKAIVDLALNTGLNLTCMTPTGISAKKLALTINFDAYTIHRRLGFRGREWVHNEINPYDTDVAILDESSMIDQEVFYRMLCALKKRTHMIFVGDQDQLPSVGAGNVLKEIINSGAIPVIKLTKIFRQAETSDIIKAAHKIKDGDTDLELFKSDPKADIFFWREKDPAKIEGIITAMATKFKSERRLFQIITPRNDGPLSVESLNKTLQQALNPPAPDLNEINMGYFILRKGDRVIIKKNDYDNQIYNGDIGKVISIGSGKVLITVDERIIELNVDEVDEKLKLAYVISCHKSQGMEYPYIILPFINQFGKNMLQRNLLYTALTRAKEKVIVLGHGSALERAINNASVTQRNTALGERISKCIVHKKNNSLPAQPLQPQNYLNVLRSMEQSLYKDIESSPMGLTEESPESGSYPPS